MWRKSENILHRLSHRQISTAAPNTHIHRARLLYENIVPNHTVYDVECPDYHIRKFSNDGQYLICFSRNYQNLVVYRHNWLTYCCKGENSDTQEEFPSKGKKFESYFSQLYSLNLASGNELICKDFFLATDCNCYGIFATATAPDSEAPTRPGAVPGVPSIEKITLYLVRLADGTIVDERKFHDDFIHLAHNVGIFMYDDFLSILSVRYQAIHILQVRKAGMFVDVRTIGPFCREDDELILNSHAQEESLFQNQQTSSRKTKGLSSEKAVSLGSFDVDSNALSLKSDFQGHSAREQQSSRFVLGGTSNLGHRGSGIGSGEGLIRTSRNSQEPYHGYTMGFLGAGQLNQTSAPSGHGQGYRMFSDSSRFNSFPLDTGGIDAAGSSGTYARMYSHFHSDRGQWSQAPSASDEGVHTQQGPTVAYGISYSSTSSESQFKRNGSQSLYHNSSSDTVSNGRFRDVSGASIIYGDPGGAVHHRTSEGPVEYVVSSRVLDGEGSRLQSPQVEGSVSRTLLPTRTRDIYAGLSRGPVDAFDGLLTSFIHDTGSGHVRSRVSQGSSSRSISSGEVHMAGPLTEQVTNSARALDGTARSGLTGSNHRFPSPASQETSTFEANLPSEIGANMERDQMLGGMKQRLLSYIFRSIESQDADPVAKAQRLKRFYYHFQHYVDLVMWKVQFLDRYHLLIKFGSVDGVVSHNLDTSHQTAFFVIYNFESTEILGFFQNSSEELLQLFEHYYDHFRVAPSYPSYMRFISSYSNNKSAREQFRKQKAACNNTKPGGYAQVIRRTLASLPCNAQSHSPSAYFDQSLFHFDEKLISAMDQYKPCMEHPIKFISRRKPNALKFKINPGLEFGPGDGRVKRVASFIFHPIFPFAISVQQAFMQPAVVNFHLRR